MSSKQLLPPHSPLLLPMLVAFLLSAGCPGCPPSTIANPDAGFDDAGLSNDGGTDDGGVNDAGDLPDGGSDEDAGATDGGQSNDAGDPPIDDAGEDAGGEDAGGEDAGDDDGGQNNDAGTLDGGLLDGGLLDGGLLDGGAFDAGPLGAACTDDDACGSDVCRLVPTADLSALEGRCGSAGPGTRTRGDGCSDDDACGSGLCLNGLCAGICATDPDCAANQVCGSRVVSAGGVSAPADVCLRAILPDLACDDDEDCADVNRICRDLQNVDGGAALFCANRTAGTGEIGAACSGNFLEEVNFCHTGLCDDEDEGEGRCTAACDDNADCAAGGTGWTCTASGVGGVSARLCGESCVRESDCGAGRSCTRRQDLVDNRSEFICDGYRGNESTGTVVTNSGSCRSALARIDGATDERYCTEVCVDDVDCPETMECSAVTTTFPDGTGTQELLLCAR